MASIALTNLASSIQEVKNLESANPTPVGLAPSRPLITRVIGRASVVLLSSHFERYFHAINEEAADHINTMGIMGHRLPESLRLIHSKWIIEQLEETSWENRASKLQQFVTTDSWLWGLTIPGRLDHNRLLDWMSSPKPRNLIRYYRYWNIPDIFTAVTRRTHTRSDLWLRISELVDKRNNIAHGDFSTEATQRDIRLYSRAAWTFCNRADRRLSIQIGRLLGAPMPW